MKITLRAYAGVIVLALLAVASAPSMAKAGQELQLGGDLLVNSISAQRMFTSILPSAADELMRGGVVERGFCPTAWEVWATPFSRWDKQDNEGSGVSGMTGYNFRQHGVALGLVRRFGNGFIGLAGGYDYRKTTTTDETDPDFLGAYAKGNAFHVTLHGGTTLGSYFLDAYTGASFADNTGRIRYTSGTLGGLGIFHGDVNDRVYYAGLRFGRVWEFGEGFRLKASAAMDYSYGKTNTFKINVDAPSLGVYNVFYGSARSNSFSSLHTPLMVNVAKTYCFGSGALWTPEVRAGWVPHFGASRNTIEGRYSAFGGYGGLSDAGSSNLDRSHGLVGAGLSVQFAERYRMGIEYDFRFSGDKVSHSASATFGLSF